MTNNCPNPKVVNRIKDTVDKYRIREEVCVCVCVCVCMCMHVCICSITTHAIALQLTTIVNSTLVLNPGASC